MDGNCRRAIRILATARLEQQIGADSVTRSDRATRLASRMAASPIGATFSPRCANARLPMSAASWPRRRASSSARQSDGEIVSGKFTGTIQLSSGKFAMVVQSHEFTLVPWRPIIDRQLGCEVSGVVQG